jgi:SPP1 family predicted phage head-tail adaptor
VISAGALSERVTLQTMAGGGTDAIGQPLPDAWADVCTVWAALEPLQGREYIAAAAITTEVQARLRMRYRPGITAAMRVLHGQDTYNITAVIHVKSARAELQLMCRLMG